MQITVGDEVWGALARARCGLAEPPLRVRHRPCKPLLHLLPAHRACLCGTE